jgi:hypothetical protein
MLRRVSCLKKAAGVSTGCFMVAHECVYPVTLAGG